MGGPIARRPLGLLDLLLSQQQGDNPNDLGDSVQATLDLAGFYQSERITTESVAATSAVVGSSASITIPQGEAWRMLYCGTRGSFNAIGQQLRVAFRMSSLPGGGIVDLGQTLIITAIGAADGYSGQHVFSGRDIYPPGTRFLTSSQVVNLAAGGNISGTFTVCYVRLEV